MDLFYCDYTYAAKSIIENYESFVWTERYNSFGDFKIVMEQKYYLQGLRTASYVTSPDSRKLMMIETVQRSIDEETGKNLVTVSGRDIVAFLQNKSNRVGTTNLAKVNESFTGTISDIIRYIVQKYAGDQASAADKIVGLTSYNAVSPQGAVTTINVARDTVYNMVKTLCDGMGYGFYMNAGPTPGTLQFFVYTGIDKSNPNGGIYRVYTPDDDTFFDTNSLESIANWKNHARVLGAKTGMDVYPGGASTGPTGIDRRTMVVECSDVGPDSSTTVAQDLAVLARRGLEALAAQENSYTYLIDGKIPQQNWNATYFGLGDIVMVKDRVGTTSKVRITEKIWSVSAGSGLQMNPTFAAV